jgi:hypothetical protein
MQRRGLVRAILDGYAHHDVIGRVLRILDADIEVTIAIEHTGIEHFVFGKRRAAPPVLVDELLIRIGVVRILVQHLHVRMRRRAVEIKVQLLHILAMIALLVREAEEPFLDDRVTPVPQCERHTPVKRVVAESGDAVLAPAIHPAARMIVRKVIPGGSVFAVILANGAPLTLAQIRSPASPLAEFDAMQASAFFGLQKMDCA